MSFNSALYPVLNRPLCPEHTLRVSHLSPSCSPCGPAKRVPLRTVAKRAVLSRSAAPRYLSYFTFPTATPNELDTVSSNFLFPSAHSHVPPILLYPYMSQPSTTNTTTNNRTENGASSHMPQTGEYASANNPDEDAPHLEAYLPVSMCIRCDHSRLNTRATHATVALAATLLEAILRSELLRATSFSPAQLCKFQLNI